MAKTFVSISSNLVLRASAVPTHGKQTTDIESVEKKKVGGEIQTGTTYTSLGCFLVLTCCSSSYAGFSWDIMAATK